MIGSVPRPVSPPHNPKIHNNTAEEITVEQARDGIADLNSVNYTGKAAVLRGHGDCSMDLPLVTGNKHTQ